jgi:hypothetical protein
MFDSSDQSEIAKYNTKQFAKDLKHSYLFVDKDVEDTLTQKDFN